jgi:hypothetical protein
MQSMLGMIAGVDHEVTKSVKSFNRLFDKLETRLRHSMERSFGPRLAPAMIVLYMHMKLYYWFEAQLDVSETARVEAPNLNEGLRRFQVTNNLDWLPSPEDIPVISALGRRTPAPAPAANRTAGARAAPPAAADRDPDNARRRVQNNARDDAFTANSPFAGRVRNRSVTEAVQLAGDQPPTVVRGGADVIVCVSWHAKGSCFNTCARAACHVPLNANENEAFMGWCRRAFA